MNNQKVPHAFFATLGVIGISILVFLFTFGTITQNKIPQTNSFAAEKNVNIVAADPRESTDRSKSAEHIKLIENLRTQKSKTNLQKTTTLQTQSVAQALTVGTSAPTLPDLSVIYISRTPRYYRYCLTYPNNVPQLCPGTENQKHWPDVGEVITYNAHITNNGENYTGNIHFEWLVDGQVVSSGDKSDTFEKHFDFEFSQYSMPWTTEHHQIEFRINIVDSAVTEVSTANNKLAIGSHDLTISYWVESGQYVAFNNLQNSLGTYSFEDWINLHIQTLNQRLRDAKFANVPNGVADQVRIDKFVIADELDGSDTPRSNDPDLYLIDGRWQSTDGDASNVRGQNGFYNDYANQYVATIDWGLIHELTHQLGAIDLYMMNIPEAPPNNGLQMYDVNGALVTRSRFPYSGLNFPNYDLMGGGDISPYTDHTMYSFHTAAGLQSDTGHRRGFFGEYLFDTPDTTVIQILDTNGQPVSNAQVDLFQRDPFTEIFDNVAEFSVVTDGSGYAVLANRPAPSVTTITGHTEKPNPFGQIYVWGAGGMMATRVIKNNQDGYAFLLLHDLNVAYWKGQQQVAIVPVKTNFPGATPSPTPTLTPIPSPTPTLTPTLTPTITKTPTPSPTRTPTPRPTKTPTPTRTPTPTPDTTGPSVSITSPLNNSFVTHSNSTTIRVSASDPSGISKVQFYVNDSLKCTDSSSSYTCKWSVPSKRGVVYIIKAIAIDKKNNSSSTQIAVTSN